MSNKTDQYREDLIDYFSRIAQAIEPELPNAWTDFGVGCLCAGNQMSEFLLFVSSDGWITSRDYLETVFEDERIMDGIFEAHMLCDELYDYSKANRNSWSMFAMTVKADGHFNVDFDYDELPEINEYVKKLWRGRYLK